MVKLSDVKSHADLELLYQERGLQTPEAKVQYLRQTMGVFEAPWNQPEPIEDTLQGLEDLALDHFWEWVVCKS